MVLLGRARSGLIRKVAVLLEGGHEVVALESPRSGLIRKRRGGRIRKITKCAFLMRPPRRFLMRPPRHFLMRPLRGPFYCARRVVRPRDRVVVV